MLDVVLYFFFISAFTFPLNIKMEYLDKKMLRFEFNIKISAIYTLTYQCQLLLVNHMLEETQQNNNHLPSQLPPTQVVKKPPSPYMLFLQKYKADMKQGEKFNLKTVAEVWSSLDKYQKDIYIRQQHQLRLKYDEYVKKCVDRGEEIQEKQGLDFIFPTTRVKNIMKQDPNVQAKAETVLAMNKAMEFFGEHMIGIIKRNIGAKKRVELKDLWEAINVDKSLSFLQPLIDDHSRNTNSSGKHISLQTQKPQMNNRIEHKQPKASTSKIDGGSNKRISTISFNQPTLNDLWK